MLHHLKREEPEESELLHVLPNREWLQRRVGSEEETGKGRAGQGGKGRGRAGTHLASVCGGVVQCRQPPPPLPPSLTSTRLQVWQPSKMVLSNIHKRTIIIIIMIILTIMLKQVKIQQMLLVGASD